MEVEDWGASRIRKAGWPRKIIEMLINATLTLILPRYQLFSCLTFPLDLYSYLSFMNI